MIQKTCYTVTMLVKYWSPTAENPVRVQKQKTCSNSIWLWMIVLVKDCQWRFYFAKNFAKRSSFYYNVPLWCLLIQECNSLNESEDQSFTSFLWFVLELVAKKGCLKKRLWFWNLLRKVCEGSTGKSKGGEGVEPKHLLCNA